jgi:hypothetical protein
MTHQQVADTLGISRQMAARYINQRGCPVTTPDEVLRWYHGNIRSKCDRQRPRVPAAALVGPAPGSRILEAIADHAAALELDSDILAIPNSISQHPEFFPTISNNRAVRQIVGAFHRKWFGGRA